MNCQICFEPFDHSIRKPYSLSSCPHTYCVRCLQQIKKCPQCSKPIKEKNTNMALLELIPESNYDKLKAQSLKAYIDLNEIKKDLKTNRESKLNKHKTKLTLIKKVIGDQTNKVIDILKSNEIKLTNECDKILDELNSSLDADKFEESISFQIKNKSKAEIEKNNLTEDELKNLSNTIFEIKMKLNELSDEIKNYENNFKFISNEISNDCLLIGKIMKHEKVFIFKQQ